MSAQRYTPDIIARAEHLVSQIQGISSCRIAADETGEITEVHVVATGNKPPKLVSRDVETCLQAELGITIDYKKIGVVVVETAPQPMEDVDAIESDADIARFPLEEYSSRFAFQSVNMFISQTSVQAEVELLRDGIETFGRAKSPNVPENHLAVIVEATLNAVSELLDEDYRLCFSDVAEVSLGDDTAIVVKVDLLKKREHKSLAGCSLYSGSTNQTAVFATLDATNRVLGVLGSKDSIKYKID